MNQRGDTKAQVYDALWNIIISKFTGEYFPTKIHPLFYAFFGESPGLFNRTAPHGYALVDDDDIHCLMIGAADVGKTANFLYPNLEYACACGKSSCMYYVL
jgi:hypothetical protein